MGGDQPKSVSDGHLGTCYRAFVDSEPSFDGFVPLG